MGSAAQVASDKSQATSRKQQVARRRSEKQQPNLSSLLHVPCKPSKTLALKCNQTTAEICVHYAHYIFLHVVGDHPSWMMLRRRLLSIMVRGTCICIQLQTALFMKNQITKVQDNKTNVFDSSRHTITRECDESMWYRVRSMVVQSKTTTRKQEWML